jgi:predicted metalloprotease with PDZ domain
MKIESKILSALLFFFISSCSDEVGHKIPRAPEEIDLTSSFFYEINLNDRSDDTFKVRIFVDNLESDHAVFQFPATTPGTYDIHDIGRFVTTFKAFDEHHNELSVTHTSTNQWVLSDPESTRIIEFEVKETFDTPVTENNIYRMAGTSIEHDHALVNNFDILGYPTGLKERDFYLDIDYPASWSVGTSLPKDENGFYYATNFDKLVDSPLLLGNITTTTTIVDATGISVYAYSKSNLIQALQILTDVQQVLDDASAFLNVLPVDRYSFLFHFAESAPGLLGALEHSYSSVYTLSEQPYSAGYGNFLRNIAAHEFFHIVTPLNIHSEIIEDFNFAVPTPSEHLWLYEGVTEWASHMMQYRNQHRTLDALLEIFASKKSQADGYNQSVSLSQMSLTCYGEGGSEFGNVYRKGALVAALLDIRLLELSGGTKGLREVIIDLINTYGSDNAFSEANFFDDLAQLTGYPTEVTDFMNKYIKGTDALPIDEYFTKIGISYTDYTFTVNPTPTAGQLELRNKWSVNF